MTFDHRSGSKNIDYTYKITLTCIFLLIFIILWIFLSISINFG